MAIEVHDYFGLVDEFDSNEEVQKFLQQEITFWSSQPNATLKDEALVALNKFIDKDRQSYPISNWHYSKRDYVPALIIADVNNSKDYFLSILKKQSFRMSYPDDSSLLSVFLAFHYRDDLKPLIKPDSNTVREFTSEMLTQTQRFQHETILARETVNQFVSESQIIIDDKKDEFNTLFNEQQKALDELYDASDTKFKDFHEQSLKKIDNLEEHYVNKLRLEPAASYWAKTAKKQKTWGIIWLVCLVLTCATGVGGFLWLFLKWLKGVSITDSVTPNLIVNFSTNFTGLLIFITMASITAFLIRTFSKLTFSAFHLQKDAEEREQLAYVYLAMCNEDNLNDNATKLIAYQALFSRSDSGLLKGDSGPTMPGAAELLKMNKTD